MLEPPWGGIIGKSARQFNPKTTVDRSLSGYRAKRSPERTPEPFGPGAYRPLQFVVQQHGARRLHWDLRLEWGGVLLSWAVPKGPSMDPSVKRLAVRVEDHPIDYADFEGIIPAENYGAGPVIVWDLGRWVPIEDPTAGLANGKLLFDLAGYKLQGRFTLVRTRGGEAEPKDGSWLWIKKADAFASSGIPLEDESVLSGLSLHELKEGSGRAAWMEHELERLRPPRRPLRSHKPMLAESRDAPFTQAGWIFEAKYDGFRLIALKSNEKVNLIYRSGRDATERYPEIARALAALPYPGVAFDGELVVLDEEGRPCFQDLQQRAQLVRRRDIARASVECPAVFYVFDLIHYGGFDLRGLPLLERKRLLAGLLPRHGPLRFTPHFEQRGEDLYREATKLGFEGIVAKRADTPYRSGRRSGEWLKIRRTRTADLVIVGLSPAKGGRSGFGALHLAAPHQGGFRYVGRVGTGFGEAQLRDLREVVRPLERETPACQGALPRGSGHVWLEPQLACEVRFAEVTRDGLLRQPVFLRLRPDKPPDECDALEPQGREPSAEPAEAITDPAEAGSVSVTNPDKIFWPEDGLAKKDLVAYYRAVSPWLLPYLRDRPVVLTRYPDGIHGKSFFQKDAPQWVPAWMRTETLWSEHANREIHYFVCDRVESLVFLANLGTIPLHVWSSRIVSLARPDWCILDLDPKQAPFEHVVAIARWLHRLCERVRLTSFVKTSGSTGLHLLIPLGGQLDYEQSRSFAELLARLAAEALPELATVARSLSARKGRVYIDYLQNGHGRLLVAPFSLRPLPGAPVSMPLRWHEVKRGLDPRRYTLRNALRRMARLGEDPLRPVLDHRPDLRRVLSALEEFEQRADRAGRRSRSKS